MTTATPQSTKKLIDVEKVIASKNPRLLQWMPRFVLNYIKRIVHQDDINREVQRYQSQLGRARKHSCSGRCPPRGQSSLGRHRCPRAGRSARQAQKRFRLFGQ